MCILSSEIYSLNSIFGGVGPIFDPSKDFFPLGRRDGMGQIFRWVGPTYFVFTRSRTGQDQFFLMPGRADQIFIFNGMRRDRFFFCGTRQLIFSEAFISQLMMPSGTVVKVGLNSLKHVQPKQGLLPFPIPVSVSRSFDISLCAPSPSLPQTWYTTAKCYLPVGKESSASG